MKARVKATGEIIELSPYGEVYEKQKEPFKSKKHKICHLEGIEIFDEPDYWTRLEHQYAGMAMQGMIKRAYNAYCDDCANYENMIFEDAQALLKDHAEALADVCVEFAHALVEKMKEKKK